MKDETIRKLYQESLKKWERLERFASETEHVNKIKSKVFDKCAFCEYCNLECYRCPIENYICDGRWNGGLLAIIKRITDLEMMRDAIHIGTFLLREALEDCKLYGAKGMIPLKREDKIKDHEKKKGMEGWL